MDARIVKKHMIAIWIEDDKSEWCRIKKSTAIDLALNPETVERDYIVDENPTTEIDKYKPSLNQALTMYKGEPDFDTLYPMAYRLPTGKAAKRRVLIGFIFDAQAGAPSYSQAEEFEEGEEYYTLLGGTYTKAEDVTQENFSDKVYYVKEETNGYRAWLTDGTLSFTNINGNESTLTFDINFGGTIERGIITPDPKTKKPVFVRTDDDGETWIDPFDGN